MNSNFFQCRTGGCHHHGSCIDQQTMTLMMEKIDYNNPNPQKNDDNPNKNVKLDFERELLQLQELLQKEQFADYNSELNRIAKFILENCSANDPSSLRNVLQLQSSNAFATWSDETAKTELAFCNTRLLQEL